MPDFKLPDLGEGVTEGEIDRWLVKEGDVVAEDDLIVEVVTDKATAEIPSPFAGVVATLHYQEGDVVPVGSVLITIGEESKPEAASALPPPPAQTSSPPSAGGEDHSTSVKAMPPVRKLARDLGVDITAASASGPNGRVVRADVEALVTTDDREAAITAPARHKPITGGRREPLRGIRRTIAERMAEAHRVVPAVTHVEECDVTELDATRKLANERNPDDPKLTFLPFIIKAVVAALKDYPALNSTLDEDANEIVYHDRYDIGVAVDTPSGLIVPVIRDTDAQRVSELAAEIDRLARGARDSTLSADELRGSTFTVTSPGPFGGLMATPIVFYPQAAILGVHKAGEHAVVRDGQIVARLMMNLSVTFDHRILDGMTAARFIGDVVRLLEHPAVLALKAKGVGREAVCSGIFDGRASEGKALLESDHVLWRGEGERVRLDFQKLESVDLDDGSLVLAGVEGSLILGLGSPEAERWAQAILHPKTIIDKMGLVDGLRVSVLGVTDSSFLALLGEVECDVSSRVRKNSDAIVVQVDTTSDLSKLDRLEPYITRSGMIWVVSPKGQKDFNENHVYAHMRALGLKDVKTARFSDTHTANKFVIPKERR